MTQTNPKRDAERIAAIRRTHESGRQLTHAEVRLLFAALDATEADLERLRAAHAKCPWPTGGFID